MSREQTLELSIAISSGSGIGALTKVWDICRWMRITPTSETDTYDVTVKDGKGRIMLVRTSVVGTFAERIEMSLGIMDSISIANASVDGTYFVNLDCP